MGAAITQSTLGIVTLTGAIQEGKLGETGQRTDKTGDNKQEEDKKEKKDSQEKKKKQPRKRTTLGTPGVHKQQTRFKTGMFSKHRQCKTNKKREGES